MARAAPWAFAPKKAAVELITAAAAMVKMRFTAKMEILLSYPVEARAAVGTLKMAMAGMNAARSAAPAAAT